MKIMIGTFDFDFYQKALDIHNESMMRLEKEIDVIFKDGRNNNQRLVSVSQKVSETVANSTAKLLKEYHNEFMKFLIE